MEVIQSCVHGSETWLRMKENELALHLAEMKNITWICDGEATDSSCVMSQNNEMVLAYFKEGQE